VAAAIAAGGLLPACGPLGWRPTPGRIALLVALGVMGVAIGLAAASGGADREGPASKPSEASGGWVVLASLCAIAALVIGTCNTFTEPPPREVPARAHRPPPPPSPGCGQATAEADRAFAALADAERGARAAAIAMDRACRVEAAEPAAPAPAAPATPAAPVAPVMPTTPEPAPRPVPAGPPPAPPIGAGAP
jgi:hypothetical protein